jgi:tetratricopeptide (TPR) repeat protein/predicted Ser/Thr protein kinase
LFRLSGAQYRNALNWLRWVEPFQTQSYQDQRTALLADLSERLQQAVGDTYRIERELGGGGMSRVFLADEVRLGRQVVIKLLPPDMSAGVNVERFEREIRLAAKLQHPHIVPLLTAGAKGDLLYYVMPFIKGESLRAKLAREGELPIGEAARILRDVADALAYAHREGVVHRDIKPDNVLISDNHAVVTDFGVAKAVSASTGESSLTSLGVALGTPAYMAPEQAAADPNVDHRADIYALGALAYEMLTGRPPFAGTSPQVVLSAHVTQAPDPVTTHRETVPPALAEVVMRCLAKKPADRYQRADDLRAQFEAVLTPTGGITPTGTQPVSAVGQDALVRRAHPGRVAMLFGLASVGALAIVYLLMYQLGLPDWVFVGAIALLAIGLPIMLLTGHHERRRAIAQTRGVQVSTRAGLRQHFTWRKALLGGGLAFTGLTAVTVGYTAMRAMGIGPVGTLVAAGMLDERGQLIVADFEDRTPDGDLGESVTEAFRIDLSQSTAVRVMDAAAVSQALRRMNLDLSEGLSAETARELAEREGVKAIVAGDIGTLGRSFVVSVRLLSSADGAELVALRETAQDDAAIIGAVDRLSGKLRERVGESLKSIRANEPLERVTTASVPALRRYSRAQKAEDSGDSEGAQSLLEEAIQLDSTFAMAYRKLAVVLSNAGAPASRVRAAATKAYEFRARLPDIERYLATAYYYSNAEFDRTEVIKAYRAVLDLDPDETTALNNLSLQLFALYQFEEAERLLFRAVQADPSVLPAHINLMVAQVALGKLAAAESSATRFAEVFPADNPIVQLGWAGLASARGEYAEAEEHFRRLGEDHRGSLSMQVFALGGLASVAQLTGRLRLANGYYHDLMNMRMRQDNPGAYLGSALEGAWLEVIYRGRPEEAVRIVESALERYPLEQIEPTDRPYAGLAEVYAAVGQGDTARRLMAEYARAVDEGVRAGNAARHGASGFIALAEGQTAEAIRSFRMWYDEGGDLAARYALARAFDVAGDADSALAHYEHAATAPRLFGLGQQDRRLWQGYLRLGELYEQKGEREKAAEYYGKFVDLWKDADAELQQRVGEIKTRIAALVGEGE